MPDGSIDVVFINACYGNIADKAGAFSNITRMMKTERRMVISHPLWKSFIHSRSEWKAPFPLDDFPEKSEAEGLLKPFGFDIETFISDSLTSTASSMPESSRWAGTERPGKS